MTAATGFIASARPRSWTNLSEAWQQVVFMALVITATWMLARVGGSSAAKLFYVAAAGGGAIYSLKRSPWFLITLTLWFWSVSPFVRRVIDYNSSFDPVNFVLGAPNLMTLFMLRDILTSKELLRHREALLGLLLLLPIIYGLGVNLVQGDIVPGLAASADWFTPMIYFYYVLTHWRSIGDMQRILPSFLMLNGTVMAAYGIYQFFDPTPWDAFWATQSHLTTIGNPKPYEIRVFGTLNSPGPLAFWVGTILLLLLHFRTRLTGLLVPALILLLMVTFVRSVLGSTVVGLCLAALMGRTSIFKTLGIIVVVVVLGASTISAIDPDLGDKLFGRVNTVGDLGNDQSAIDRQNLYRAAPAMLDANPLGIGIGGVGRGAVAGQNDDMVTLDSGVIIVLLTMGWFAGWVHLVGMGLVLLQALMTARQVKSTAALTLAVTALAGATNLPFMGIAGLIGVLVWLWAAAAMAIGIASREARRAAEERVDRMALLSASLHA